MIAERGGLRIGRWTNHYLVPAGHPDPDGLRQRLDAAAASDLAPALAQSLAPLLRDDDQRICFIKRVDLPVTLQTAWSAGQIGRVWSAALTQVLARALAASSGDDIVIFRDRAEYLGAFLVDLAGNRAWSRWYYGPFAGLRLLPLSAALRTTLSEDPPTGLLALLRLSPRDRATVLAALSDRDAARVLDSLAAEPGSDLPTAFRAAAPAWRRLRGRFTSVERLALDTFILAHGDHGGAPGHALATAARALAALDVRRTGEREGLDPLLVTVWPAASAASDAPLLALHACPEDLLAEIRALLTGNPTTPDGAALDLPTATAWGGMFFLLPLLDELGLERVAAGWPGPGASPAAGALRLLVLASCGGPHHRAAILGDPLARRLSGVDPHLTPGEIQAWAASLPVAASDALLAALDARWQDDRLPSAHGTRLAFARVPRPGAPVAVVLDLDDGAWRFVGSYRPGHLRRLLDRAPTLAAELAELNGASDLLIADETIAAELAVIAPHLPLASPGAQEAAANDDADAGLAEGIARLGHLAGDLAYVLPRRSRVPLDWAVAMAAQHTLRVFSRRLPGFSRSSLDYLARNFLDVAATLTESEDGRRLVRLGRPPLGLVLALTGAHRGSYCLSWLDEREFTLFPDGDD